MNEMTETTGAMKRQSSQSLQSLQTPRAGATTDRPTLPAYRTRDGSQLVIWCDYCKACHSHGAAGGTGHRVAHCWEPSSPYRNGGYYLKESSVSRSREDT
jgi:hypothetical protein